MKVSKTGLCVYRGVYWANQGLLTAVRALEQAQAEVEARRAPGASRLSVSSPVVLKLRRTQTMIEETREVMNRILADWTEREE